MRTARDDGTAAVVHVNELAFGLAAAECRLFEEPELMWVNMGRNGREVFRSKARFALGIAEDYSSGTRGGVQVEDDGTIVRTQAPSEDDAGGLVPGVVYRVPDRDPYACTCHAPPMAEHVPGCARFPKRSR
jgi:hypothetical protein